VLGWIPENSEPNRRIDIARHLTPVVKISECIELGSHLLFHAEVSTILRLRTQVCHRCAMTRRRKPSVSVVKANGHIGFSASWPTGSLHQSVLWQVRRSIC